MSHARKGRVGTKSQKVGVNLSDFSKVPEMSNKNFG